MNLLYNKMENLQNEYTRTEQHLEYLANESLDITEQMLKDFFNSLTEEEKEKFYDKEADNLVLPLTGMFDDVWIAEYDQLCCTYNEGGFVSQIVADILSVNDIMALMETVRDVIEEYNQTRTTMNEQ